MAQRLKDTFRSSDIVGRVGGDEFMVLMTNIPGEDMVLRKTKELCRAVCAIRFREQKAIAITASIGVSLFVGDKSFDVLFAEADDALYCAKGNGKNQYVFASVQQADGTTGHGAKTN